MRLLVISHTPHYVANGTIRGWGPTVRELDRLSSLFDETTHLAIRYDEPAPPSSLPYASPTVRLRLLPPAGGDRLGDKLGILARYPEYLRAMLEEMRRADFVHVRCPANLSLLALIVLAMKRAPAYRWVKYAGNWSPSANRPPGYALQRAMLLHNLPRAEVSVNGAWPGQKAHIHSFFNPSFHQADIEQASQTSREKRMEAPLELIFAGRLETAKGVELVVDAARMLREAGVCFNLRLIGDGPQVEDVKSRVAAYHLEEAVHFAGWLPHPQMAEYYRKAHLMLLPSASEGWPKVLSEGMAYGVVPLASTISSIPQNLKAFGCGRALPQEAAEFAAAVREYAAHPEVWKVESLAGMAAARYFTYEAYLGGVQSMALSTWGLQLPAKAGGNARS